jgi:hypothetical protein
MTTIEDPALLDDQGLAMALTEWKRWRNRVILADTMNRRQERYEEACARIAALEEELEFRHGCKGLHRAARQHVACIAVGAVVALDAYRSARDAVASLEQRMRRLPSDHASTRHP